MSALGAFGAIAGNVIGGLIQQRGQERTNWQNYQYNKQLSEQAYRQNMQAWHEQNAYNSPIAQMGRLKAAGLNPALMYGQMESGNAGSPPELQYSPVEMANPMAGLASNITSAMSVAREYELLESQKEMNEAKALESISKSNLNEAEKDLAYKKFGLDVDRFELEKKVADANIGVLNANARKLGLDSDAREIMNRYIIREKEAALSNVDADTWLKQNQAQYQAALASLTADQRNLLKAQAASYIKSIDQMNASIMLMEQQSITSSQDALLKSSMVDEINERIKNYEKERQQMDALIARLAAEARDKNAAAWLKEQMQDDNFNVFRFVEFWDKMVPL